MRASPLFKPGSSPHSVFRRWAKKQLSERPAEVAREARELGKEGGKEFGSEIRAQMEAKRRKTAEMKEKARVQLTGYSGVFDSQPTIRA